MGVKRLTFKLPKDEDVRFRIAVSGIDEEVGSIHRLELMAPARGFVTDRVTFSNVRVVTKR